MSNLVRVKICGITNLDDALAALAAGADALGFIFCDGSPRRVSVPVAAKIMQALPPFVTRVGVFANAPEQAVRDAAELCGLDVLQFHGDETPDYCRAFHRRVIKAFRIRSETDLQSLTNYQVAGWLLDSYVAGQLGGTGETFNWELARRMVQGRTPVILAGGLTPGNVAAAVRQVQPYGVDVSSGVESAPGKKDHQKLVEFVRAAKDVA